MLMALLIQAPADALALAGNPAPFTPIAPKTFDPTGVLLWALVLIVAAVVGSLIIALVRDRYRKAAAGDAHDIGIMEHLRRLRASGTMTEQEFQAARARLIDRVSASMNAKGRTPAQPSDTPAPAPGPADAAPARKPQQPNGPG
ncbi:MAG: hypothetical protein C0475_01890 [Planctomyces sp.]|nr:hypothetical protein [Planctomyces sp.]